MRLLLDTHAFLWWLAGSGSLSLPARRAIGDEENSVLISAASAWETTTKYQLGKLPDAAAVALDFGGAIADQGFEELAISVEDASHAGSLSGPPRDPFDRMLIAQALSGNLVLVSKEAIFEKYGVRRLW